MIEFATEHPIKIFRENAGISRASFAEQVGCTRWTIYMIERGERSPSTALLLRICALTKIGAEEILNWTPAPKSKTASPFPAEAAQ